MGIFESTGLLFLGILKRLYWLIPSLLSDPFDISERWLKVTYEAPQWAFWLLLSIGLSIAIILTCHELRVKVVKLEKQLDDRDKKKAERGTLAVFLNEGQSLKRQCENEKEPPPKVKTTEWAEKIENWLIFGIMVQILTTIVDIISLILYNIPLGAFLTSVLINLFFIILGIHILMQKRK